MGTAVVINNKGAVEDFNHKASFVGDRIKQDKLNNSLDNHEFIVVDVDPNNISSIVRYMYIALYYGVEVSPNNIEFAHRVSVVGEPSQISMINLKLMVAAQRIGNEEDPNHISGYPIYEILDDDWSTEEGRDDILSKLALCMVWADYKGERATLYVPEDFELPYQIKYSINAVRISKEDFEKLRESAKEIG